MAPARCATPIGIWPTSAPGDFFGEIALLETDRRVASVTASSPVRLAVMSRADFRAMSSKYPEVGQRLRDAITERNANRASRLQ